MALTRKMLKSMNLTEEQVDSIIEEHTTVTNALKEQIANHSDEAEKLSEALKEIAALKKQIAENSGKDYEALKAEYEKFKADVEAQAVRTAKETAMKDVLKDIGINERHWAKILKYSDFDSILLDKDGKLENAKDIRAALKEEWSDHIETQSPKGSAPEQPPTATGSNFDAMSLTEKMQFANANPSNPDVVHWLKK